MGLSEWWEDLLDLPETFRQAFTPAPMDEFRNAPVTNAQDAAAEYYMGAVSYQATPAYNYYSYDSQARSRQASTDRWSAIAEHYDRGGFDFQSQAETAAQYERDTREDDIDEPEMEVSFEPVGDTYQAGYGGLLVPGSVFTRSEQDLAQSEAEELWSQVLDRTGVDMLGLDDEMLNWWPGLELQQPDLSKYGTAGFYQPGGLDYLRDKGAVQEAWQVGTQMTIENPETGQTVSRYIRYDTARSAQSFAAMGTNDRGMYTTLMAQAGLVPEGYAGVDSFTAETASAFTEATRWANYYGITVKQYLQRQGELLKQTSGGRGRGGGGGAGRRYTIEVPDYETITKTTKDMLRQKLGRDPKDWEITLVADEMQRQYGSWADAQERKALGGNGVYEVPDPTKLTEQFIESKYEDELARLEDVEERAENNRLLVRAATAGAALNRTGAQEMR